MIATPHLRQHFYFLSTNSDILVCILSATFSIIQGAIIVCAKKKKKGGGLSGFLINTFLCNFFICQYIIVVFDILKSFAMEDWVFGECTARSDKAVMYTESHQTNDIQLCGSEFKDNRTEGRFICSLHTTRQIRAIRSQTEWSEALRCMSSVLPQPLSLVCQGRKDFLDTVC